MSVPLPPASKRQELIIPDHTPQGVITEILLRLPVKSLLEYKSVSKSWYSLISSPSFIKSQLAITTTAANHNLIVHNCDFEYCDSTSLSLVNLHSCQVVDAFDYMPLGRIVGSANGIVCVDASNLYLWNPATRQYKIIAQVDFVGAPIGFGFDPIDNDFKLVVANAVSQSQALAVYSANRNVWRKVPTNFPYKRKFHVCVNGFLFSVGFLGMTAFDLNKEVLSCDIKLPVTTFQFTATEFKLCNAQARVTEFNASIAVIISKRHADAGSFEVNLWKLDDEACLRGGGIEVSWTLMLNIDISGDVQFIQAYFNTGDILILVQDVWCLYDPYTKEFRNFPDSFHLCQIFKCKESLVTIAGFKQVNLNPPDDVITKILLCLPFNSLLRFKSVSKSWLSLISSPNFAKTQLAIRGPDQIHIVHSYKYEDESDTSFLLVDLDNRQIVADLNFPFSQSEFPRIPCSLLVGSACGIVCVHAVFSNVSRIYLWNPATKKSKRIPSHNIRNDDIRRVVLGFGFEPTSTDFKVLRIVSPSFSAEVYSSNNNAWRNVEPNHIDFPNNNNFDVCVNGILYTAGRYGVIAFNLKTEVFNCAIKFPPTFDNSITKFNDFDPHARITEFEDFIAVIISTRNEYACKIDLWALNDEACFRGGGTQASWTRILNIDVNQPVQFIHGYFKGGDFLLLNDWVWFICNLNSEEADWCISENEKGRRFTDAFYCGQIFRYTKSLFEIAGSKQVNWNAYEDDN